MKKLLLIILMLALVPQITSAIEYAAFLNNLRIGMAHGDVVRLQKILQGEGYFPKTVAATGYFGPITKKAVQDFQRANNIIATGYFGPLTREAMHKLLSTHKTPVSHPGNVMRVVGEREENFFIQKINQNSVEGLWYTLYPVATNQGIPKTFYVGDYVGYQCEGVSDQLVSIDYANQKAYFYKVVTPPPPHGCPI